MSRKKADKPVYTGFGERLSSLLVGRGKRKALANAAGVTTETVRTWCNGTFLPFTAQLLKIKEHLQVDIDWLLTGEENTKGGKEKDAIIDSLKNKLIDAQSEIIELRKRDEEKRLLGVRGDSAH